MAGLQWKIVVTSVQEQNWHVVEKPCHKTNDQTNASGIEPDTINMIHIHLKP